jgi:flagellin-like hook-associated protein FlgL
VPALLNIYIDEMTSHETSTLNTLGIPVEYSFPRLSAYVVAELAYSKAQEHALDPSSDAESGSSSSSTTSDDDSDDESDPNPRLPSPVRRHLSLPVVKGHVRRVTDPVSPKPVGRPRSQTTGLPLGGSSSTQSSSYRVDPLVVLERAIEELKKVTKDIDDEASKVSAYQNRVDQQINAVVLAVDEAQKAIDNTNFQQVRSLHLPSFTHSL